MGQKCLLIIADGLGCGQNSDYNAFYKAKTPTYDALFKEVPNTLLKSSGEAVGLPKGQIGNSEVGHLCIGAGRVIRQNLSQINALIKDDKLKENKELKAFLKAHENIHVIGLYSDGGVHSMHTHFKEIIRLSSKNKKLFAHMISDGRDVPPGSAAKFCKELKAHVEGYGGELATLSGRFYAMDRDERWDRVQSYYHALLGDAPVKDDFVKYIKESAIKNISDEFIKPVRTPHFEGIKEEDGIILINFRNDRMKELVRAFIDPHFTHFKRPALFKNILTMSVYDEAFKLPAIIKKPVIENTLSEVISANKLSQLHTAETEKYAHVTFFFNAQKKAPVPGEKRVLIPSPKVKSYDETPAMSAPLVADAVIKGIKEEMDFIVINFANCDMVGHTGDMEATVKAVEAVDAQLGRILKAARDAGYAFILTADHGNCELMANEQGIITCHTNNPVYAFLEAKGVSTLKEGCSLTSLAASVLKILGLEKPSQMDTDLIKEKL